jgi:hypothetical protein
MHKQAGIYGSLSIFGKHVIEIAKWTHPNALSKAKCKIPSFSFIFPGAANKSCEIYQNSSDRSKLCSKSI